MAAILVLTVLSARAEVSQPAAGHRCTGECDFHPMACSEEEGIVAPAPKQDVPIRLAKENEAWCTVCLALVRQR
ncbi:hypothetical protein ACFWRT_33160 [Streptomyces cyaneofuscatus]|uniref:hypothetical protein n=1 Tax=Streptomyces cyaneofuscatus TaxID=66883 RepID=UPI00365431CA